MPDELGDLTAEINGVVYDHLNFGGSTIGYTIYVFSGVESGGDVILWSMGNEVSVALTDARSLKRGGVHDICGGEAAADVGDRQRSCRRLRLTKSTAPLRGAGRR